MPLSRRGDPGAALKRASPPREQFSAQSSSSETSSRWSSFSTVETSSCTIPSLPYWQTEAEDHSFSFYDRTEQSHGQDRKHVEWINR